MPAPSIPTSPDIRNYFIGKGNVYVKNVTDADNLYVHVGNVPKFEFIPKLEKKKHYSHMAGTRTLDRVAFTAKEAELQMNLEEITPSNLIMALLLGTHTDTTGQYFELLELPSINKAVKLTGTNDFGAKVEVILHNVFFSVEKALALIGDDWMAQEITGDVLRYPSSTNGSFGTLRFIAAGA